MKKQYLTAWLLLVILPACHEPNAPHSVAQLPQATTGAAAEQGEPGLANDAAEGAEVASSSAVEALTALQQGTSAHLCNIEGVGGRTFESGVARLQGNVVVTGWLGHADARPVQRPRLVVLDDAGYSALVVDLVLEGRRDDVSAANGNRAELRDTGFRATVPTASLPVGNYRLVLIYQVGDVAYRCDNGRGVVK